MSIWRNANSGSVKSSTQHFNNIRYLGKKVCDAETDTPAKDDSLRVKLLARLS